MKSDLAESLSITTTRLREILAKGDTGGLRFGLTSFIDDTIEN